MSSSKDKPIGTILVENEALSAESLEKALKSGRHGDPPLLSRLTREGVVRESEALKALSAQTGQPGIDLNQVVIRGADLKVLVRELAEQRCVLAILKKGKRLFVAMPDPSDAQLVHELEAVTGHRIFAYIALKSTLRRVIREAYGAIEGGDRHYVGANCPAELLERAGVSQPPPPLPSDADILAASEPAPQHEDAVVTADPRSVHFERLPGRPSVDEPDLSHPEASERQPIPGRAERGTKLLLVADNDPDVRRLVSSLFRARDYEVTEIVGGARVLEAVRNTNPTIVLLDASFGDVHGLDVARDMKASDAYRHIPIVMMSGIFKGWRFAADLKENYGIEGFVEKPFRNDDLVHRVTSVLEQGRSRASTAPSSTLVRRHLTDGIAAYQAGKVDEAVAHLKRGIELDPLSLKLRFQLGLLYGKVGQLYDAIEELEKAVRIRSTYFPALKNLAVLYQNAGFRNKAIELWGRCLHTAPDEETRASIKRLLVGLL